MLAGHGKFLSLIFSVQWDLCEEGDKITVISDRRIFECMYGTVTVCSGAYSRLWE